jgi:anti-sigma factor RsiW
MSGWRRNAACERAARLISLELDGELGRRERAVLDRHLGRCPDCTRLKETTRTFTTILRLAPHERPPAPVPVPNQKSARPPRRARALVSILAFGAFAATAVTLLTVPPSQPTTPLTSVALAERVRLFEAELVPPQDLPPLKDDLTTTPLPVQALPACSLGCWPESGV